MAAAKKTPRKKAKPPETQLTTRQRLDVAAAAQEAELAALADVTEGRVEFELFKIYLPGETPQYIRRVWSKSGKILREEIVDTYEESAEG